MKDIYANATEVYIWIGQNADNSDLAMESIAKKGTKKLQPRGPRFRRLRSREECRALRALFEKPCWRRMWIIQEIIYAEKITVWYGKKWVD
jgi:hypothetical protein